MPNVSETAKQLLDAWNNRDWDVVRSALHPECNYIGPDGQEARGIEPCLAAGWTDFAVGFPDGRVEVKAGYADGDVAITEFVLRGTHSGPWAGVAPTQKTVEVGICNIMQFRGGKLFRERDYLDTLGVFAQLGVVQMPST